ncbi:hypothetical protein D915_008393, partial [Fasciola hepatica]
VTFVLVTDNETVTTAITTAFNVTTGGTETQIQTTTQNTQENTITVVTARTSITGMCIQHSFITFHTIIKCVILIRIHSSHINEIPVYVPYTKRVVALLTFPRISVASNWITYDVTARVTHNGVPMEWDDHLLNTTSALYQQLSNASCQFMHGAANYSGSTVLQTATCHVIGFTQGSVWIVIQLTVDSTETTSLTNEEVLRLLTSGFGSYVASGEDDISYALDKNTMQVEIENGQTTANKRTEIQVLKTEETTEPITIETTFANDKTQDATTNKSSTSEISTSTQTPTPTPTETETTTTETQTQTHTETETETTSTTPTETTTTESTTHTSTPTSESTSTSTSTTTSESTSSTETTTQQSTSTMNPESQTT